MGKKVNNLKHETVNNILFGKRYSFKIYLFSPYIYIFHICMK